MGGNIVKTGLRYESIFIVADRLKFDLTGIRFDLLRVIERKIINLEMEDIDVS
jgi:hypothetical protein